MVDVRFKSYFLGRRSVGPRKAQFLQDEVPRPLCSDTPAQLRPLWQRPTACGGRVGLTGRVYLHSSLHSMFSIKYVRMAHSFRNISKTMTSFLILCLS